MLNKIDDLAQGRRPRSIVRVTWWKSFNQQVTDIMYGWEEWEVENNAFRSADTFMVRFSLSKMPAQYNLAWWTSQQEMWIEILAGFPDNPDDYDPSAYTSWIYGKVDEVSVDPITRTLEVHGRDLTAQMLDTKTTQKWQNMTSSQIAKQLAGSHGLTAQVTSTSTKVGKFYEIEHARMTQAKSEWDLLSWLAQEEGFVCFVRGKTLHFQPKPDPTVADPYVLAWLPPDTPGGAPRGNAKSLNFSRNLTLARDIMVTVKSWNMRNKKGFTKVAKAQHVAGSPGAPQMYSFTIPNLTPDKALKQAQALLAELSQHEVRMSAALPGDNLLDITSVLQVVGTDSTFDQMYFPEKITRSMSLDGGYSMRVSAKNSSPNSMVTM